MSNQDEPVDGPTGEYRKEIIEEVEPEKRQKSKGEEPVDIGKKTIKKSKEDTSEDTSNESVTDYGVGEAS